MVGMLINLFWLSAPKPLKVTLYIGLGWLVRYAAPSASDLCLRSCRSQALRAKPSLQANHCYAAHALCHARRCCRTRHR